MSESYTIGDDTNFQIIRDNWIAQTFTPVEDHRLWFVHLKLHGRPAPYWALMSVQTTLDGIPTGEKLDEFPIWLDTLAEYSPGKIWRPTLHGTANLLAGTQYAIIISQGNMRWADWVRWRGQSAGATYPRGQRLSSSDGGASWTPHPDSDCYFVEFGTPPLPKPEPPPPIEHFATLDLQKVHFESFIVLILATPVPCHLTCYYTDKQPLKHPTERVIRGATLPWGTYFCFVAWDSVEQIEPGDTLYHTFKIHDWSYCQTKWFTFRGTVDEVVSPSIGPIFKQHHPGGLENALILRPIGKGIRCSIPTEVGDPCPDHWKNVDEETPDEEETMLSKIPPDWYGWAYDFFTITPLPTLPLEIDHITLTARCRREGGPVNLRVIRLAVRTHNRTYWPTPYPSVTKDWRDYKESWYMNPYTYQPWTYQEINDLEIAIDLSSRYIDEVLEYSLCTQMYLSLHFKPQES